MVTYLVRRLFQAAIVVILITLITFFIIHAAPGGPSLLLGEQLTQADREHIRHVLGLDQPLVAQYYYWVRSMLRFDFGNSFSEGVPVLSLLARRLPNTLMLASTSLAFSIMIGVPIGIVSALRRNTALDYSATFAAFIGVSIPSFWFAIMAIILFSVKLGWLPSSGMASMGASFSFVDRLRHLLLPSLTLAIAPLAQIVRYMRSSMLDTLQDDYVRTARSKGLREQSIILKHALRNAFNPVLSVIGFLIPPLIGGSVIVETIFAWPGMGRLAVDAALKRDYPVMMGITVLISVFVVSVNLLVDVLYARLDPRIRLSP